MKVIMKIANSPTINKYESIFVLFIISSLFLIGCTKIVSEPTSDSTSPSKIVEYYYKGIIGDHNNHEKMYEILSKNAKPNDFDKWSDYITNVRAGMSMSGFSAEFVSVSEQIENDRAIVQIKCKTISPVGTVSTTTGNVLLTRENGNWKLIKNMQLSGEGCLTEEKESD